MEVYDDCSHRALTKGRPGDTTKVRSPDLSRSEGSASKGERCTLRPVLPMFQPSSASDAVDGSFRT